MNQQSERYLINKLMVKVFVLKKKRNAAKGLQKQLGVSATKAKVPYGHKQ